MSVGATLAAYLALLHESYYALLGVLKIAFNEEEDFLDLFEILFSAVCCCFLAYGVIRRFRPILKIWLLLSYAHIDWSAVVNLLTSVIEFFFTDKYRNKQEFAQDLGETHASIVAQVLRQCGSIVMIYKFFQSLEPPKEKLQAKLAKMYKEINFQ